MSYFHVLDKKEEAFNYATFGTKLLLDIFRTGWDLLLDAKFVQMDELVACERTAATAVFGKGLTENILVDWVGSAWALNVAYEGMASRSPVAKAGRKFRDRVFFRWYCHLACGDLVEGELCNHAVAQSEAFRAAYECGKLSPIKC